MRFFWRGREGKQSVLWGFWKQRIGTRATESWLWSCPHVSSYFRKQFFSLSQLPFRPGTENALFRKWMDYPGYQRFFSRAAGIFDVGRRPTHALEKSLAPRVRMDIFDIWTNFVARRTKTEGFEYFHGVKFYQSEKGWSLTISLSPSHRPPALSIVFSLSSVSLRHNKRGLRRGGSEPMTDGGNCNNNISFICMTIIM